MDDDVSSERSIRIRSSSSNESLIFNILPSLSSRSSQQHQSFTTNPSMDLVTTSQENRYDIPRRKVSLIISRDNCNVRIVKRSNKRTCVFLSIFFLVTSITGIFAGYYWNDSSCSEVIVEGDKMVQKELDEYIASKFRQFKDLHFGPEFYEKISGIVEEHIVRKENEKIGLPDLALESSGGSIITIKDTKSVTVTSSHALFSFLGMRFWTYSQLNTPRSIIQTGISIGDCWAFEGSQGEVFVRLVGNALISSFTLEHIPKQVSPHLNIQSAPENFQVFGVQIDSNGKETYWNFGFFTYQDNGIAAQNFKVQNFPLAHQFSVINLRILSNHGNSDFTCVYRFRVHGTLVTQ